MVELPPIHTPADLCVLVREYGFLPYFSTGIPGFSIDDVTPNEVWKENLGLGPWLWRDDIAREKQCVYGKFFNKKVGYVSVEWLPHLINFRRDGFDFDEKYEDGQIKFSDKRIYDLILRHGPISAPALRREAGVDPKKSYAFDSTLARLQMLTYIVPVDFIFPRDAFGQKKYGYGVTVFDLPVRWLGEEFCKSEYDREPEESLSCMTKHLNNKLPGIEQTSIANLLA